MQANKENLAEQLIYFGANMTGQAHAEKASGKLLAHMMSMHEEEKASIGRNIHDDLGGKLTAMKLEIYLLAKELSTHENTIPFLMRTELMMKLINIAMSDMRRIINDLHPAILDKFGLKAALENHIEQFSKNTSIECMMDYALDADYEKRLSSVQSTHFFRILEETLSNVKQHSHASRVSVEIQCDDGNIAMSVSDNGRGIPENQVIGSNTYGLLGIEERVKQLGGKLSFGKPPGGGFSLTVRMPAARRKRVDVIGRLPV